MAAVDDILTDLPATMAWQELYRDLHRHPELSLQETRTNRIIADRIAHWGYDVREVGGGVVGVLRNGDGPCVLFRADTDALPVQEDTGLAYASTVDGVMHACGHDLHVTWGLGAAQLLASHQRAWSGTYVALFQPAEETAQGARAMVDDGLVDRVPRPDVALGQHVMPTRAGLVSAAAGPRLSAADSLRVTVHGKGSHGSMPHLGVDPVVVAAAIVLRLQTVVAREIAPADFGVVTVGSIQAGAKSNVIPDRAVLLLNVRSYDESVRERILAAIERIVRGECEAGGCPQPPEIDYYDQFPLTVNDKAVTEAVTGAFVEHFGAERVAELAPLTGSEDFSVVPDAFGVPYSYWTIGGFPADADPIPNHNPRFAPVLDPTLRTGTEAALVAVLAHLRTEA
ncbi:amidohydrolase [Arsenicicoccus sp. oral taxon 190]|uniref:amidohydrolase n=1 Tax=Arsenicicoccus sp. oral taxon 190 TaxID=1658671 RepID=UPI000A9E76C5|nr:amidohydrolase [Arsenicicoccus sp. oral taxon 190]